MTKVGTFISTPSDLGRGEELEVESVPNHAYVMKHPLKLERLGSDSFRVGEHSGDYGRVVFLESTRKL